LPCHATRQRRNRTDRSTPQLALLAGLLKEKYPQLELGSVDGFQGREKEAVIVSTVRSNPDHEVGFLGEKRRLNVAMTRPKRHLCIVGDSDTISKYVCPSFRFNCFFRYRGRGARPCGVLKDVFKHVVKRNCGDARANQTRAIPHLQATLRDASLPFPLCYGIMHAVGFRSMLTHTSGGARF
jgi:hypothetical protein